MPTYVYKCAHCGHTFEARQKMADNPLTECPSCDESALRRVINNVGIVFKGSGFYVTDNRNGRNGAAPSNGSGTPAKEADSKSEAGGESKSSTTSAESQAENTSKKE